MIQAEQLLTRDEVLRLSKFKGFPDGSHDNINFASDLSEIELLQRQYERTLGLPHDPFDLLYRSYNPVIDRWHVEKLRRKGNEIGEADFTLEIRKNWEKNLRERLATSESTIRYRIFEGGLYSEDFPDEPFTDVLKRGAEYRLANGTPEPEREGFLGERAGFEKIQLKFRDPKTKPGTVMTSFSPKGVARDSAYRGKYIDEFKLMEDKNGRFVQLRRMAVDLDLEGYRRLALELDPRFFERFDGRPIDAWFLSHPVEAAITELKKKGMLDERFERIWKNPLLQGLIDDYVREITADSVDWWKVAPLFNAILNQADKKESFLEHIVYVSREIIQNAVRAMGWITPKEIGGGGCPINKGINLGSGSVSSEKYEGSVAKFAGKESKCKCLGGNPDNHYHCPDCGKKYADETNKAQRTEKCSCGFKFNC